MKRKTKIPFVENFMKQKVLFQISSLSGTRLTKLTPPQGQPLMRARKCCKVTVRKAENAHLGRCSVLVQGTRGQEAPGRSVGKGGGGCGVSGELKPRIARCCGPGSLLGMVLAKGWLRLRAGRLLPGDTSILWHELVRWLICPVPLCPLSSQQLCLIPT